MFIRKEILEQVTPFCISDLYDRLEQKELYNKRLIMIVLNELYDEGLVEYKKILPPTNSNSGYAFLIIQENKKAKELIKK